MKKRLPQIHIAGRRQIPAAQSPILRAVPFLLMVALMCVSSAAKDKRQKDSRDPYATAENYETAPAVNAADLAYRTILFDDFTVPPEWEEKARKLVTATEEQAISRLSSTHAFTTVAKRQNPLPEDPSLVVKCTLLNYRMVSKKTRFFGGRLRALPTLRTGCKSMMARAALYCFSGRFPPRTTPSLPHGRSMTRTFPRSWAMCLPTISRFVRVRTRVWMCSLSRM